MDQLIDACCTTWKRRDAEGVVTGNNDADGVYLLDWVRRHFPDRAAHRTRTRLAQWRQRVEENVANIDNLGNVHRHHVVELRPGQREG